MKKQIRKGEHLINPEKIDSVSEEKFQEYYASGEIDVELDGFFNPYGLKHEPLSWFYKSENIPNQNMIHDVIDYFEIGQRKDFMEPYHAVNIFYRMFLCFKTCINSPFEFVQWVNAFSFSPEERHVMYGLILYWHGGYPTRDRFDGQCQSSLRLIEKEFLKYEGDTPEKVFCQVKPIFKDEKWWMEKKTLDSEHVELVEMTDFEKAADLTKVSDSEEQSTPNKEHTTIRQALAIYYLLRSQTDMLDLKKIDIESFVHFLTDKSKDTIHKTVSKLFVVKNDINKSREDYDFVIQQFKSLGLEQIVVQLKKDRP